MKKVLLSVLTLGCLVLANNAIEVSGSKAESIFKSLQSAGVKTRQSIESSQIEISELNLTVNPRRASYTQGSLMDNIADKKISNFTKGAAPLFLTLEKAGVKAEEIAEPPGSGAISVNQIKCNSGYLTGAPQALYNCSIE